MLEKLKSRKLWLTVLTFATATILVWHGKISDLVWLGVVSSTEISYKVVNAAQKKIMGGIANEKSS